jgi:hypothetical protein
LGYFGAVCVNLSDKSPSVKWLFERLGMVYKNGSGQFQRSFGPTMIRISGNAGDADGVTLETIISRTDQPASNAWPRYCTLDKDAP